MSEVSPTPEAFRVDITRFIQEAFMPGQTVGPQVDLLLSGVIDSMGVMALVAEVERLIGRSVPPQDVTLENFVCVEAITAYATGAVQ